MKIFEGKTIDDVYKKLIEHLKTLPVIQNNTHEIENCCLHIKQPRLWNFSFPYRKISTNYCEEELKWYWSGDNSCHTIGQFAKMWLELSDDGETNNSAYGYILFKKYGKNQLEEVIQELKKDSMSRKAVLNISDPKIDRLHTKDMQCTIAIQFTIRNNKLNTTVYMRSNDVYFGLPYDYIFFMSLAYYVANELGLSIGTYTHNATSLHMYHKDFDKFNIHDQNLTIDIFSIIKKYYAK